MKYAPVRIAEKRECMEAYKEIPKLSHTIQNYMICTIKSGNIDDNGNIIVPPVPVVDGCNDPNNTQSEAVCKKFTNIHT